ncbi:hypothetical protein VP06_29850 [Methylobacterium aquaticum]|uniref:Uncharacterized protein n=2 Tax=Methylobacterium aquaticum TaxID=270351 RepID=A0A0J6S2H6_9HYPH|nr:hypothetical protein VP06_29850 [Methylobacterium aquaticum]
MITPMTLVAGLAMVLHPSRQDLPRPALVRGLPARFADADSAFRARVAEAFPLGSSEEILIRRLRGEGFDVHALDRRGSDRSEARGASVSLPSSACTLTWRVRWRAQAGTIVSASGDYGGTCL